MKTENQVPWSYKNVKVGRTAQNKSQAQIESKKLTKISLSIISWTQHLWAGIKKKTNNRSMHTQQRIFWTHGTESEKKCQYSILSERKKLSHTKKRNLNLFFFFFYCECDQLCNSAYLLLLVNVLMQFGNEISDPKVSVTQGKSKKKYFYGFFSLP